MYDRVKALLLRLARVPPEPLDPMGDARSLRVFRASPGYLRYITVGWLLSQAAVLIGLLIGLGAMIAVAPRTGAASVLVMVLAGMAAAAFVVQAVTTYFLLRLHYELRWYKVTDRSLRIRAGVLNVHEMTMTFANVQNITVTQGPLERLFGISDVRVETAGGGSHAGAHGSGQGLGTNMHVGVFRGVDNPEEIRDLIADRLRRLRDTGLGDPDEMQDREAAPAPVKPTGAGAGPDLTNVLAAFLDEARALRRVAEATSPGRRPGS
jgi:membrane protein YdbS with pleckstrin-like domain